MGSRLRIDELRRDANLIAGIPNTALQHVGGIELRADGPKIFILALELKRRSTANHRKTRNLGQQIEDLLRHAVTEILLVPLLAHIRKRQHRYRFINRAHPRMGMLRRPEMKTQRNRSPQGDNDRCHQRYPSNSNRTIGPGSSGCGKTRPQHRIRARRRCQSLPYCLRQLAQRRRHPQRRHIHPLRFAQEILERRRQGCRIHFQGDNRPTFG